MDRKGQIIAICISSKRGTKKREVEKASLVEDWGIVGDAHAGKWHRQVSLLPHSAIREFQEKGAEVSFGDFGENLVISGFDLKSLPVGTRLSLGEAVLQITQIGKECHSHCAIYQTMGECIMPKEGVFTRVVKGGIIRKGGQVIMEESEKEKKYTAAVITLSDKGAAGERMDISGPVAQSALVEAGYEVSEMLLLPDDKEALEKELIRLCDEQKVNLIVTNGGTGFSPRDVTPEATLDVCERMAEGIADALRSFSLSKTPQAMFSRAVSGIRGSTLIVNLPGSPQAVNESLEYLLPNLEHGLEDLRGEGGDCARPY